MKAKVKICFVGIHNKPGKEPLDSTTKTGKVIDRIIEACGEDYEFQKRNLFTGTVFPPKWQREGLAKLFKIEEDVLYIGLGLVVRECLFERVFNFWPVYHPGYIIRRGNEAVKNYVDDITHMIKTYAADEKLTRIWLNGCTTIRVPEDCPPEVIQALKKAVDIICKESETK